MSELVAPWEARGDARAGPMADLAGRYRLGPALGHGGMADVYDGTDLRLARAVAVKVLRAELAADRVFRIRFETEARSAARLSHPHVVAVYDTGEDHGIPFIVMERLAGRSLADDIASGPLAEATVVLVAAQVLQALGAAHAAGLVHRDVKPANILWSGPEAVKVADFGIAKSFEPVAGGRSGAVAGGRSGAVAGGRSGDAELTASHLLIGTPGYLAPERLDGGPATPGSDIWSLGVVLYEALAGTRPFPGDSAMAVAASLGRGTMEPLASRRPGLDPRLAATVQRALAVDPQDRFASTEDMAAALAGVGLAGVGLAGAGPAGPGLAGDSALVGDTVVSSPAPPGGAAVPGASPRPTAVLRGRHRRRPAWGLAWPSVPVLALLGAIVAALLAVIVAVALVGSPGVPARHSGQLAPPTTAPPTTLPATTVPTTMSPPTTMPPTTIPAAPGGPASRGHGDHPKHGKD